MADYLKNCDLLREIRLSKQQDKLTDNAVKYISKLADKLGNEFDYKNPDDREDCRQEGIMNVLMYWRDFDESITTNAFSYYSQLVKTGYGIGYNRLYKKSKKRKGTVTIAMSHLQSNNNQNLNI